MTVWICQCLCPERHCLLAAAGEAENEIEAVGGLEAPLRRKVADLLRDKAVNPWCALCGALPGTWCYETRRTVFATMDQAGPALTHLQAENDLTNRVFGDMPKGRLH